MSDLYDIYDGETPNRLSTLMYCYCLMDDYPSYDEAKDFFLGCIYSTYVCRKAAEMKPEDAAEYVYEELLADKYPRSEFPDLISTAQDMIKMSLAQQVDQYEGEARKILLENGDLS